MTLSQQIKETIEWQRKTGKLEAAEFLESFLIKQRVIEKKKKCNKP